MIFIKAIMLCVVIYAALAGTTTAILLQFMGTREMMTTIEPLNYIFAVGSIAFCIWYFELREE